VAVELLRLREEQRLARQVDTVAEDVRRGAHVGGAGEKTVDLLPPRREGHRAVEDRDTSGVQLIQLAGEADHRAPAERDDHGARAESGDAALADPLERGLALEEAHVCPRERSLDERQRLDGTEDEDVAVVAPEHEPRPGRAALLVLRPLHLVEDESVAAHRGHLRGAADDRRAGIDPLLAGHEPDLVAELLG
jgi:hypothetical protein